MRSMYHVCACELKPDPPTLELDVAALQQLQLQLRAPFDAWQNTNRSSEERRRKNKAKDKQANMPEQTR